MMGATASFPDRKHAERALWERMSSLDEACDALDARSATASEARARRRLINGARSVFHRLRAAHSASEALDNALAALSARREAVASLALASPRYRAAANDALDDAQRENSETQSRAGAPAPHSPFQDCHLAGFTHMADLATIPAVVTALFEGQTLTSQITT